MGERVLNGSLAPEGGEGRGEGGVRRYILRRVAAMAATLVFVSVLVFVVIRVLPGDPALIILGIEANPDTVARLRHSLGLDQPMPLQYLRWVGRALTGDLGRSIQYDVSVSSLILSRLHVTLPLTILAAGFMALAAVPLGVFAATRHRRWGDYLTMILSQLGIAVPGFWAGLLLILLFSVKLGWVQAGGFDGSGQGRGRGQRAVPTRAQQCDDPGAHSGGHPARPAHRRQHHSRVGLLPARPWPPGARRHQCPRPARGAGRRALCGLAHRDDQCRGGHPVRLPRSADPV